MFDHDSPLDPFTEEGIITEVDAKRKLCKVRTLSGKRLTNVRILSPYGGASRSGARFIPMTGESVCVYSGLGNPIILGFLPKVQSSEDMFPVGIDTNEELIDTGDSGISGANAVFDRNAPKDIISGDNVLGSIGGGMVAILRSGTVLIRSSRVSEIFLSKLGDLVRIVSRNYEHFTDLSTETIRNIGNRVYRYFGVAQTFSDAKNESYSYHQYYGDTAIAQGAKSRYTGYSANPTPNDIIAKEQITNSAATSEFMHKDIHLDGQTDLVVRTADGTAFTRIRSKNNEVFLSYNDSNVITINPTQATMTYGGVNVINVNASSISLSKGGDPLLTLDSSGVNATFSGHYVRIDSSGVHFG